MPLDPRLEPLRAFQIPTGDPSTTPAERREMAHTRTAHAASALMGTVLPVPMASVRDEPVAVDGGTITVRIYRPINGDVLPAVVSLHGGGWWMGSIDHTDHSCRKLAAAVPAVVVAVDYRLAPEHPFPTPIEDAYAALAWTASNAARLGVDETRIAIEGGSAGANIAAAVTLLARDRGGPALCAQVLNVPATDLTLSQPSIDEFGTGYGLTKADIIECVDFYLGRTDRKHPLASPLYANLIGLPRALVSTAECDPLRDDGEAYADRLRDAGVAVQYRCWEGQMHGSMGIEALVPDVAAAFEQSVVEFLRISFADADHG